MYDAQVLFFESPPPSSSSAFLFRLQFMMHSTQNTWEHPLRRPKSDGDSIQIEQWRESSESSLIDAGLEDVEAMGWEEWE